MTRHTIDIDRNLLLEAQRVLGTATLVETVRQALRRIVDGRQRQRDIESAAATRPVDDEPSGGPLLSG